MTVPIARSLLTTKIIDFLVSSLADEGVLVGRGQAPPAGGWESGQPGTGDFTAYVTLKTGSATTPAAGEPARMGTARTSWDVAYSLTSVGALESHADDTADKVRFAIVDLPQSYELRGFTWVLQQVRTPRLGPTLANNATDPPFWEVTDDVSLHLSLELTT